eukprot:Platyproteum_vivax@DN2278_c0_g1_i1.p1
MGSSASCCETDAAAKAKDYLTTLTEKRDKEDNPQYTDLATSGGLPQPNKDAAPVRQSTKDELPDGFTGTAKRVWDDDSCYDGEWLNGQQHGYGKYTYPDGAYYLGQWIKNQAHGYGEFRSNKASYSGQWREDKKHGQGREIWKNKNSYEGRYENGKKHGMGRFEWNDGSLYIGEFDNNIVSGHGKFMWTDGRKYVGEWKNSKMNGEGRYTWPDGRIYEGNYKDDLKDGYGTFTWPDQRMYQGNWANGVQHGYGRVVNPATNEVHSGYWEKGVAIRMDNDNDGDRLVDRSITKKSTRASISSRSALKANKSGKTMSMKNVSIQE